MYPGSSNGIKNEIIFKKTSFMYLTAGGIGDFDGDGFDDITVGIPEIKDNFFSPVGQIEIYTGKDNSIIDNVPIFFYKGNGLTQRVGEVPATFAGDLNKDGYNDIIAGIPSHSSPTAQNTGSIRIINGKSTTRPGFTVDITSACISANNFKFLNNSYNAEKFTWDFGDGETSTEKNPVHSYKNPGIYTVTLTAYDLRNNPMSLKKDSLITVRPVLLPGTYTIGKNSNLFKTTEDFNQSIACGISGNIEIEFENGIYNDPLLLDSIKSFGGNYNISVKSASGNRDSVTIAHIIANNTSNVSISSVTIDIVHQPINYLNKASVEFKGCNNISISNCKVSISDKFNRRESLIVDSCKGIVVRDNYFSPSSDTNNNNYDGSFGVIIRNSYQAEIRKNRFERFGGIAIVSDSNNEITIHGNDITGRSQNYVQSSGISITENTGIKISSNRIHGITSGIDVFKTIGTAGFNQICNNSVYRNQGKYYQEKNSCISVILSQDLLIANNTAYSAEEQTHAITYTVYLHETDNIRFLNNLIRTEPGLNTVCIFADTSTSHRLHSDYNFFSGPIFYKDYWERFVSDLNKWISRTGGDYNSFADTITFAAPYKLKPVYNLEAINEAGVKVSDIIDDIEGVSRGNLFSDIGAYNVDGDTVNFAGNMNPGIVSVDTRHFVSSSDPVKISVVNFKPQTVNSLIMSYQIDNNPVVSEKWEGSLGLMDTLNYTFTQHFNSGKGKIYYIKSWISLTDNLKDTHKSNDSLRSEIYKKMEGPYTIGGPDPDFKDLITANNHLQKTSYNNPIVFNIRPGQYELPNYTLVSGPVTYTSESGSAAEVQVFSGVQKADSLEFKKISFLWGEINNNFYLCPQFRKSREIVIDQCIFTNTREDKASNEAALDGLKIASNCRNISVTNSSFTNLRTGIAINDGEYDYELNKSGYIRIGNNKFENLSRGIAITPTIYPNFNPDSIIISGNEFSKLNYGVTTDHNIYRDLSYNVLIDHNKIDSCTYAIRLYKGQKNWHISRNTIINCGNGIMGSEMDSITIVNNMISQKNSNGSHSSIDLEKTEYCQYAVILDKVKAVNILNNSMIGGIDVHNCSGIVNVINNSFYSDTTMIVYAASNYKGSHNNFYRADKGYIGYLGQFNGYFKTLNDVQERGHEQFSVSENPEYFSDTDLHSSASILQGKGKSLPNVKYDIDGQLRSSLPDIGADESDIDFQESRPLILSASASDNNNRVTLTPQITFEADRSVNINKDAFIYIYTDDNVLFQKLSASSAFKTDTNKVIFNVSEPLSYNTQYYVLADADLFYSKGFGNTEITDKNFLKFTTLITEEFTVTTQFINDINNIATVKSVITPFVNTNIKETGVCWSSTDSLPLITEERIFITSDFSNEKHYDIPQLNSNVKYYLRSYVLLEGDTVYGNVIIFNRLTLGNISSSQHLYTIFPVPAGDYVYLRSEKSVEKGARIIISDILGNVVAEESFTPGYHVLKISVAENKPGVYMMKILSGNDVYIKSFIKQ